MTVTNYGVNIDKFQQDRDGKVGARCCRCKKHAATMTIRLSDPMGVGVCDLMILCKTCGRSLQSELSRFLDSYREPARGPE